MPNLQFNGMKIQTSDSINSWTFKGVLVIEALSNDKGYEAIQRATVARLNAATSMMNYKIDDYEWTIVHDLNAYGGNQFKENCDKLIKAYKTMRLAVEEVYRSMYAIEAAEEFVENRLAAVRAKNQLKEGI